MATFKRLPPWSWHGLAGVILAGSVGLSYGATLVIVALAPSPVTDRGAEILTNLGSVLVGAVATWLGTNTLQRSDGSQAEPDEVPYDSESNAQGVTSEAPSTKPEPTEDQYIDDVKEAT